MPPEHSWLRRLLGAVAGAVLVLLATAGPAAAHTDFEESTPEDGATVTAPLERVVLSFSNPATPSGDGLVLLDEQGNEVPTTVEEDGADFVLVPRAPLGAGTYGVRWEVRAGDAHPIDGDLTFVVAPAETSPSPSTATTSTPLPTTSAGGGATPPGASALADALADDGDGWVQPVRALSRLLVTTGAMVALGGLAVLATTIRGRREELRAVLTWIRAAGVVVAVGGVLRLVVLAGSMPSPVDALTTPLGVSSLLRALGGVALAVGLPAGRALADRQGGRHGSTDPAERQWSGWVRSVVGLVGAGMVLVSFWFDGHTYSQGPWVLHAGVNAVHVAAAAVWSGGVLVLAALVWRRYRRDEVQDGAWLVARFSGVAGGALAAVAVAGAALAVIVLESPSELWSTPWGRLLLVKVAVVAVAAGLGALVHVRLRPALERDPADPELAVRVRRSFTAESVAFVVVLAVTAWLVGAAT